MLDYSRPRGAVHDLNHIATLSSEPCILLCVSARTLYILQNWAGLDVQFLSRYAVELLEGGYEPVTLEDPLYSLYEEVVERVETEVIDMECTILEYLQRMTDAIEGGSGAEGWEDITDVPGFETAPYYDPPASLLPPPGSSVFCNLSWSFAMNWAMAMEELLRTRNTLGVGIIGQGVALIVAILAPPIGAVISICVLIVTLLLEYDIETTVERINEAVSEIACGIYTAGDVQQAMANCASVVQAMPQLNQRTKDILLATITHNGLNEIWAGTYPVTPGAPSDCSACPSDSCPFLSFREIPPDPPYGTGYLGADGTLRTLYSVYDSATSAHRIDFRSDPACACLDYTLALVSLNGYSVGVAEGEISNCVGAVLWSFFTDPNPPPMTTYVAKELIFASPTAFTLSLRIS